MILNFQKTCVYIFVFFIFINSIYAKQDAKLVLWVTIDQLNAELFSKIYEKGKFGEKGFKYLINNGTWYKNANYRYSTTFTAVGHASLFIGALPKDHGIISNEWIENGKEVYSVKKEDKIITPENLTMDPIGDNILKKNKNSKIFSVSIKDRGSVFGAGHKGKAFWINSKNEFISSEYYYPVALPTWATTWNEKN